MRNDSSHAMEKKWRANSSLENGTQPKLPSAGVHLAELPQLAASAVGKEGEPPVTERNS